MAGFRREPLWRHVLGDYLRRLRHRRGETLDDVARRAGVSPQYLSEVERGMKEPSSEMIAAIAGALDVTLVDLTGAIAADLSGTAPARVPATVGPQAFTLAA
ncbi:transcriptional regulator, XRE family [Xylanimonas cellulosilytica DSM 15894]|uniref:Transcriptional regulator, XRE family n=1 Tax=Xylanimonas cellulosilytica (strain DSM 15894 / JCM 12276 / CECT 5975 / KCTC 9989 / LMG 20990 / NBRC 107835 / XIL07) TaxID=446471 RepID=D1BUV9_XYLCX|nr:helix-turn-helix transcriptional regulator [Xylanimonas cellulosilytica]ACZ31198.1 transcriptional regulator, XRE family [Xylanimonas cellulosilytica DSM 15894]